MPAQELRRTPPGHYLCGLANWHPAWMQRFANTKSFMVVYGLLGTIQAMSYMYFVVTLTTLEKRFKIPSQTTGIILSGNEISQIMLSLILSYIGGQRNRPRWIAWGIVFCGLSCYILALPHFIYGAGPEALQLTKEYNTEWQALLAAGAANRSTLSLVNTSVRSSTEHLCGDAQLAEECDTLFSIVPLVLIFVSQFVLGVGNTLYYSLGQTYLDDNTKKSNTPLMLAVAMALRMVGPIIGFLFGFVSLNMFIDPTKTPLIDNKDPRWLGAWWFGWTILGTLMVLCSGLIGLFPKELPKKRNTTKYGSHLPHALRHDEQKSADEGLPLGSAFSSNMALDNIPPATNSDFPKLKDFPTALMRLLRNKLLIFNILSAVFYILGAAGFMTFLTKYMEVQFHKTSQSATIVVGPISVIGMVVGLIGSGLIISKKKPSASKVLMWNVIVGFVYIVGQISYMFLYCPDSVSMAHVGSLNLTQQCNANCSCAGVPYTPICHEPTETSYFSACHAGCTSWNPTEKVYGNCSCLTTGEFAPNTTPSPLSSLLLSAANGLMGTTTTANSLLMNATATDEAVAMTDFFVEVTTNGDANLLSRSQRSLNTVAHVLRPGVCLKGCNIAFWTFSITSMIINWFGSSGRIGNLLVNYRAVATADKSFAQGLALMMISLLALIPGPIIVGRIIDSTCLVWTTTCNGKGNCQLYDQSRFRYAVNTFACALTLVGIVFDLLVWYYGRDLDLYGEKETKRLEETARRNKPITPLLSKK